MSLLESIALFVIIPPACCWWYAVYGQIKKERKIANFLKSIDKDISKLSGRVDELIDSSTVEDCMMHLNNLHAARDLIASLEKTFNLSPGVND